MFFPPFFISCLYKQPVRQTKKTKEFLNIVLLVSTFGFFSLLFAHITREYLVKPSNL